MCDIYVPLSNELKRYGFHYVFSVHIRSRLELIREVIYNSGGRYREEEIITEFMEITNTSFECAKVN